jgi:predicted AlkP superfamily phosphohydrolase/phosphomutase
MPVMAELMRRGTYGCIETMEPTFSPVIWTTMATGKMPKDHGIEGFVYRVGPGEDGQRFYTSGHRATKAFWNILSDYSRTVDCLGWWMTYPAEKINGVMVAQTNTTAVLHDSENALLKGTVLRGVEDQVYPPTKQDEVMDIVDGVDAHIDSVLTDMFGKVPHPSTDFTRVLWDQSQWAFRADQVYLDVAKKLLASGQHFDMLAVYVGGTDVAAHRFWQYTFPQQFEHPPVAKEIAVGTCSVCHGLAGQGDYGPKIRGSSVLSDPRALEALLRNGKNKMPPVGATWDDTTMRSATRYLKEYYGGS